MNRIQAAKQRLVDRVLSPRVGWNAGFTLPEMLVSMIIMGILGTLAVVAMVSVNETFRVTDRRGDRPG